MYTAASITIRVFWYMKLCRLVDTYHCFGRTPCFHFQGFKNTPRRIVEVMGAPKWRTAGLEAPQTPQNQSLKNTDFVSTTISNVLCNLLLSRDQPLKMAINW